MLKNAIEMFIDFSKHMGDLGINSGLPSLENSFGEIGDDKLVVRRVYYSGVCHVPVPVVKKKLSLGIYTYLIIGSGIGYLYYFHCYIITSVIIFDVFHIDVTES